MRITSLLALFLCVVAATVTAQPNALEPASCLLFPTVDSEAGAGKGTIISVTNTNGSKIVGQNRVWLNGDVFLHYYYVGEDCRVSNVGNQWLTPNDTFTVFAGDHNRSIQKGYLFVVAEDPETGRLINFNWLIGSEIIVDAKQNRLWSVPAIGFKCLVQRGDTDNNGRFFADLNKNGSFDFDGIEYDFWPDELFISSFFNQDAVFEAEITLVSGLGADYRVTVNFDFYDNKEEPYSFYGYKFTCWLNTTLLDISAAFGKLVGDPREANTGWARINSSGAIHVLTGKRWYKDEIKGIEDAPIVGAFVERVKGTSFEYGHLLHHTGAQNGNEFPWRDDT
jgi:hypothetical protein